MKKLAFLSLMFFSVVPGISQKTKNFEFVGTITLDGGQVMTYKIVFDQNNTNYIKGYSVTDISGANQTKTYIEGIYDTGHNLLSFKELGNAYSKLNAADSTFCFVTAKNLTVKTLNSIKIISGNFEGLYPSGETCAKGKILLTEKKLIDKVKAITDTLKINPDSIKKATEAPTANQDSYLVYDKNKKMVVTSENTLLMTYQGQEVSLDIWDGGMEDDDMISIYLNDSLYRENITLIPNKETLVLPTQVQQLKLKILALNIGQIGMNTVNFAVRDEVETKEFSSKLKTGESCEVELRRKKK